MAVFRKDGNAPRQEVKIKEKLPKKADEIGKNWLSRPEDYVVELQGDLSINEGALTENYVAAELVKHGHQLHYYDHKSRNELDFLLQEGKRMSILEVKSGKDYKRHSSLTNALMDNSNKIGRCLVLNKYNVEQTENVTYLPLYMAAFV